MIVGVVDGVEELSRLWQEGADLAVAPAAHQRFSVVHELRAVALQARDLNSEQLLSGLRIPDSDVVDGAGREHFAVCKWERYAVDALEVARVSQLSFELISVGPVDSSFASAQEEMSAISGCRD